MHRFQPRRTRFISQTICLLVSLLFINPPSIALEQNEAFWSTVNFERPLTEDKQWEYLVTTQTILENESQPWRRTYLEAGLGYHLTDNKQGWVGYRWTAHRPNNGYYQENRIWQQFLWTPISTDIYRVFTRSRLEEIERGNEAQISIRLRQRFSYLLLREPIPDIRPFIYDEIFMQPKTADWTPSEFFSENRVFFGFRWIKSKTVFWELGYMNQFLRGVGSNQNIMNHILMITYNDQL